MKKFLFILLLTVTPIIKPYIQTLEIYYSKNKEIKNPDRYQWRFDVDKISIEHYTNLLNQILYGSRQIPCDRKFNFYAYCGYKQLQQKAIKTDAELMQYAREQYHSGFAILQLKAVEQTEEEQKQEQAKLKEEQELTAAADKIAEQFSNDKSTCIIQ